MNYILLIFAYIYSGSDGGAHVAITQVPMATMHDCEEAAKKVSQASTAAALGMAGVQFGSHFREAVCVKNGEIK